MVLDSEPRIPLLKVGPHVRASITAGLANEPRLDIGQAKIVRPLIRRQGNVVAAMAIYQDPA